MSFWSGDKLQAVGPTIPLVESYDASGSLIGAFDQAQIDCSAYTLTLGPEAFITPNFGDPTPHLKQRLEQIGDELVIPPGQFAFLLTEEIIKIPKDAMGFISLKSFAKWQGLINVSGFHVDPGYHGRLLYSVFNAGPANIHLHRGEKLFLLWLADLDRESTAGYSKPSNVALRSIASKLISDVDRPLHSLQSLSGKVEDLQSDLKVLYRVLTALGVIAGLLFAAWALLPSREGEKPASSSIDSGAVQLVQ